MKHAFWITGLLAMSQLAAAFVQAQVAPACDGLDARIARQDRIGAAYQCAFAGTAQAARRRAGDRVVVKRPSYAEPIGGRPDVTIAGKLVRYDVYLTGRGRPDGSA